LNDDHEEPEEHETANDGQENTEFRGAATTLGLVVMG